MAGPLRRKKVAAKVAVKAKRKEISEPTASRRTNVRTLGLRLPKASEALAQEIAAEIVSEELSTGDRLPLESEMISRYGVGRSTVREALRILEIIGLITLRAGRNGGPIVGDAGAANFGRVISFFMHANGVTLGEVLQARIVLEPSLLRLTMEAADPEFLERAADLKRRGREHDSSTKEAQRLITREFHELIASGAGNNPLTLFAMALMYLTRIHQQSQTEARRREVMKEHDAILGAILAGKVDRAEKLMVDHMKAYYAGVLAAQPQDLNKLIRWG